MRSRSPRRRSSPGQSTMRHYHALSEEIYLLTSGGGTMELDGEVREVGEGDAILIPPGAWHELRAGAGRRAAALLLRAGVQPRRHVFRARGAMNAGDRREPKPPAVAHAWILKPSLRFPVRRVCALARRASLERGASALGSECRRPVRGWPPGLVSQDASPDDRLKPVAAPVSRSCGGAAWGPTWSRACGPSRGASGRPTSCRSPPTRPTGRSCARPG